MTEPAKPLAERLLALETAVAELAGRLDELAGEAAPAPEEARTVKPASRGKS